MRTKILDNQEYFSLEEEDKTIEISPDSTITLQSWYPIDNRANEKFKEELRAKLIEKHNQMKKCS